MLTKKVLGLTLVFFLLLIFLNVGFLIGYSQRNQKDSDQQPQLELNRETSSENLNENLLPNLKTSNNFKFLNYSFDYDPNWQILINNSDSQSFGYRQNSIAINLSKPHVIGNFGFSADIEIHDYVALPEKEKIDSLNKFIDDLESNEADSGSKENSLLNRHPFYNQHGINFTRSTHRRRLTGETVDSYYFQYKDSSGRTHFVQLFSLNLNSDRDKNLTEETKKAIDIIIGSLML